MNLTESDIRAVANNRYWTKKRILKFIGALFGTLVVALLLMTLTNSLWSVLVFLPVSIYMCADLRRAGKFQEEFVKSWKEEQEKLVPE